MGYLGGYAAALAFCIAATSVPAAAQSVDRQPRSQAAASASVSVKVGTLEVRDVTFVTPAGNWSIGRIAFGGFVRNDTRIRAERIDIEKVVMTLGSRTLDIPSIVITGADLPTPLFRAMTAGEPAKDWAELLASATIDQITIDRIVHRDPSQQLESIYNGFTVSGVKDGSVASARIANSQATGAQDPAGRILVRSGEVRYQKFDFVEVVRMFTGGGSGDAKRVLQRAVVDGIEVTTGQAAVRINRVEVTDVDGRGPAQGLPLQQWMPTPSGKPGLDPEQQRQVVAYASDILRFARVGRYSIEGISVAAPGQGNFSIDAITVGGLSMRGIDRIEIAGVDLRVPGAPVRFDRFEVEGISYGALIEAALNAARSGRPPDFSPSQIAQVMPRLSAIRLSRLVAETPQGPVALGELRFELQELNETINANSAVSGLKIDLDRLDPNDGRDQLMALGYRELIADAQVRVNWARNSRAVVVETVGLSLTQVGKIEIAARLENVDIDKALTDPIAAERVMGEARLGPIQIRLANYGLAERFYADAAKSAGLSPDAIRAGLAAEMRAQAIGNFGPLLAGRSADAISEFLQSPHTITARVEPAAGQPPLTVAEMQSLGPAELMQRLTITLEAVPK